MIPSSIQVTEDIGNSIALFLKHNKYNKIGILVDSNTEQYCYAILKHHLPAHTVCQIPEGEENKNLHSCETIWRWLTAEKFDRKSLLINLGGGVIGDMGGFCAASFKRGIDFVNIPTTLLAMVDASIGGKLGIDFEGFKNHIGFFQDPKLVIIYAPFLDTLPPQQVKSGFAEIIKHTLIADASYWPVLQETQLEQTEWQDLICHSIGIKSRVVEQDPHEKGLRKILNFGHTIGHAIESFYLETDNKLLHGEAIAIGMWCEAFLATEKGYLSSVEFTAISQFIQKVYGDLNIFEQDFPKIIAYCLQDKKNEDDSIRCVLLKTIGEAIFDIAVDENAIMKSLYSYKQEQAVSKAKKS